MSATRKLALLSALAVLAPAWIAHAEILPDGASKAVLSAPVAKGVEVVFDGRIWWCEQSVCAAHPNDSADRQTIAHECLDAASHLGRFTSYQTGKVVLTDTQLAACNVEATTKGPHPVSW